MTPKQLTARGDWLKTGEWPARFGNGPRYQHSSFDIQILGHQFMRNTVSRSSPWIKTGRSRRVRYWSLYINGREVFQHELFQYVSEAACEYLSGRNAVTGEPLEVVNPIHK